MTDNSAYRKNGFDKRRFWEAHVRAWQKSGLSQNEYCRRSEISNGQFCYWKRVLCKNPDKSSSAFVPVPINSEQRLQQEQKQDSGLTILLNNDIRIRLSKRFDPTTLASAAEALRGKL